LEAKTFKLATWVFRGNLRAEAHPEPWRPPVSDRMSIPLILRKSGARLEFALPAWYRTVMGAILALLVAALVQAGGRPGWFGWILLIVAAFGFLYQEKWSFDPDQGRVVHQVGLLGAAKTTVIDFSAIEQFRIRPHVEGTIPGTEDERKRNASAMQGDHGDGTDTSRTWYKKSYLALVLECAGGTQYLLDRVPARYAARLREVSGRMAEWCGKPLVDEP